MTSKEPKDLGIKIGTKREAYWNRIKLGCEENISNCEEGIIADKHMLELANKIIKEEESKH
jgi:hypothetical protein